jgi:hypothetical protein
MCVLKFELIAMFKSLGRLSCNDLFTKEELLAFFDFKLSFLRAFKNEDNS